MSQTQTPFEPIFVARHPIFTSKLEVWCYELLYRDSSTARSASFSDEYEATFSVMTNISLCDVGDTRDGRVMITFPDEAILINAPQALPPESTLVKISEASSVEPHFLEALKHLKASGFQIVVSGYRAADRKAPLCRLADMLLIDVLNRRDKEIAYLVEKAGAYNIPLMAKRIETHQQFEMCKKMGFTYFQGFFFKRPKTLHGRKIGSTELTRLKLFQAIEQSEPDFDGIAATIETDVAISYRLLTFLNSPTFAFVRKITSIKQAVLLLGWQQLKSWLRLVILTDLASPERAQELSRLSAQRAKFFELLAVSAGRAALADSLFLMGLFSLLEALLDVPMAEIVTRLPLEEPIQAALRGDENDFSLWLRLVESIETAQWERMDESVRALGLTIEAVEKSYQDSISWANTFFNAGM